MLTIANSSAVAVQVVIQHKHPFASRHILDYLIPVGQKLQLGQQVMVPFAGKSYPALVVGLQPPQHQHAIKPILQLIMAEPLMHEELRDFLQAAAVYLCAPFAELVQTAVPLLMRGTTKVVLQLTEFGHHAMVIDSAEQRIIDFLKSKTRATAAVLEKQCQISKATWHQLQERGLLTVIEQSNIVGKVKTQRHYLHASHAIPQQISQNLKTKIEQLLNVLQSHGPQTRTQLVQLLPKMGYSLNRAVEYGLVKIQDRIVIREVASPLNLKQPIEQLTDDQQLVVKQLTTILDQRQYHQALLHGVTGSGKTEVYRRLIATNLLQGQGSMILVPEIALTPQLLGMLRQHFGSNVAILHSQLSDGERLDQWRSIASGEKKIVVGARSALFAPIRQLGLIIIDESHDPSYKQDDRLHYDCRPLARIRAKQNRALLLYGSATPDIEQMYIAENGEMTLHKLPQRIHGMHKPDVTIIDMRHEPKTFGRAPLISAKLIDALGRVLSQKQAAILFLNRRGFTPVLFCTQCATSPQCKNCSVNLTYHRENERMLCHYCGFQQPRPQYCTQCRSMSLIDLGMGTQRLENDLRSYFPQAHVARMDRDSTRLKQAHEKIIHALEVGDIDILIGTQMVTKGLDISRVTCIGVLQADLSLQFPDFRASERTFQLLAQVAGRTGRGKSPGYAFIQTYNPDHFSITTAATENYSAFYRKEIDSRRLANYPPFCNLLQLRLQSIHSSLKILKSIDYENALNNIGDIIHGKYSGPVPAALHKIDNHYRWLILYKYTNQLEDMQRLNLYQQLEALRECCLKHEFNLQWDVDPLHFM